jgi:aminoglycoside phosphotransferase family enzyme
MLTRSTASIHRPLARRLYLGVVPVVRLGRIRKIGARGTPVEHAVRMKRFDERELFSHLLTRGELGVAQIDRVAERLAAFHRCAATPSPRSMLGTATFVRTQMETVLTSLEQEARSLVPAGLRQWCEREAARLAGHFEARRAGGFVRECHGDLHLDNIVRKGNDAVMFDCIEFSDALRWIDVASDLAFPLMDLLAHGRDDLASALLNGWLQQTGDFGALPALRFYIVYRALVRALVEALKARGPSAVNGLARARNYVACAAGSPRRARYRLFAQCGRLTLRCAASDYAPRARSRLSSTRGRDVPETAASCVLHRVGMRVRRAGVPAGFPHACAAAGRTRTQTRNGPRAVV